MFIKTHNTGVHTMSKGKYSPNYPRHLQNKDWSYFNRNADGELPPHYDHAAGEYIERWHFSNYDPDGYDMYGYSAFDMHGTYVGPGKGVDRNGYTEQEYLVMTDEEFYDI